MKDKLFKLLQPISKKHGNFNGFLQELHRKKVDPELADFFYKKYGNNGKTDLEPAAKKLYDELIKN